MSVAGSEQALQGYCECQKQPIFTLMSRKIAERAHAALVEKSRRVVVRFAKVCAAPVMVMTSDPSAEGEKDAALMGARCYLSKPLDLERFQRELQAAEREKGSPRPPKERG